MGKGTKVVSSVKSLISGYDVTIQVRTGRRYIINWATEPTEQEVLEAWKENRKNFKHVN